MRWLILLSMMVLCMSAYAHSQTMDYHIGIGMKPSKSTPPEVIDMKWARQYMDDNATLAANATQKEK